MIYRARAVATMDGAPIANGAVAVEENEIAAVGPWEELKRHHTGPVEDLGERVILPGLINAHCHLDYTMMRRAIAPQKSFTQWVGRINSLKRSLDDEDYLAAIALGFRELMKSGVTSVLNIEAFPELMPKMPPPPIRTWWFYELIDVRQRVATEELVAGALTFFEKRPNWLGGFGLSPHAPYTASHQLYRLANDCAAAAGMPLTTHLAESGEESEMFRNGSGELYTFMSSIGRPMHDCGNGSAFANLLNAGLIGSDWLLVHLNELEEDDFAALKESGAVLNVVHCPQSHRYFNHRPFAFRRLHELGMNICLGTDSLASGDSLSLFTEMRLLHESEPWLTSEQVLKTVTTHPARALNKPDELGKIAPGALADLIAIPFAGPMESIYDEIIQQHQPVSWVMINGQVAA